MTLICDPAVRWRGDQVARAPWRCPPARNSTLAWAPDGSALAWADARTASSTEGIADLSGSDRRQRRPTHATARAGPAPDGRRPQRESARPCRPGGRCPTATATCCRAPTVHLSRPVARRAPTGARRHRAPAPRRRPRSSFACPAERARRRRSAAAPRDPVGPPAHRHLPRELCRARDRGGRAPRPRSGCGSGGDRSTSPARQLRSVQGSARLNLTLARRLRARLNRARAERLAIVASFGLMHRPDVPSATDVTLRRAASPSRSP